MTVETMTNLETSAPSTPTPTKPAPPLPRWLLAPVALLLLYLLYRLALDYSELMRILEPRPGSHFT